MRAKHPSECSKCLYTLMRLIREALQGSKAYLETAHVHTKKTFMRRSVFADPGYGGLDRHGRDCLIFLEDGETVHNAFFDRTFSED
jgi:hypothetical protein